MTTSELRENVKPSIRLLAFIRHRNCSSPYPAIHSSNNINNNNTKKRKYQETVPSVPTWLRSGNDSAKYGDAARTRRGPTGPTGPMGMNRARWPIGRPSLPWIRATRAFTRPARLFRGGWLVRSNSFHREACTKSPRPLFSPSQTPSAQKLVSSTSVPQRRTINRRIIPRRPRRVISLGLRRGLRRQKASEAVAAWKIRMGRDGTRHRR